MKPVADITICSTGINRKAGDDCNTRTVELEVDNFARPGRVRMYGKFTVTFDFVEARFEIRDHFGDLVGRVAATMSK
jgi:hypothetical protein